MSEQINELSVDEAEQNNTLRKFNITVRDTVFAISLLLSSILVSIFGIFGGFRGGFTVSSLVLTVTMSAYLLGKGYKFKIFPIICLILSVGVSLGFVITSNGAVRFWSFILFFLLTLTWFTAAVRQETNRGNVGFLGYLLSPLIEMLINIPTSVVSIFAGRKSKNKNGIKIFSGICLSVPVVAVVMPLLMNSDEAFSGMVGIIFEETATIIFRSIFGIFIGVLIISFAFSLKKDDRLITKTADFQTVAPTVTISFLSVLSVCYLSYLFSQLAYFFDAFKGFLPEGYKFTPANYARRGFFEMSIIAAINFAVIFLCHTLSKKDNKKLLTGVNILSTFIGLFTLVIISTALSKMFLYIKSFGMTKLRITTSTFMIFLTVVFIALMLRLYIKKINIIKTSFITAAIALILLGTLNVNSVVAAYNYNAYKNGTLKEIDINTISELGDEGIPYLVLLTKDENFSTADYARYKLSQAYGDYYNFEYDQWDNLKLSGRIYNEVGQMSYSRQKAYNVLDEYFKYDQYILEYENDYMQINDFDSVEDGIW